MKWESWTAIFKYICPSSDDLVIPLKRLNISFPCLKRSPVLMSFKVHVYLCFCFNRHLSAYPGTDLPLLTTSQSHMRTYTVWSNTSSRRGCWPSTLWTRDASLCLGTVLEGTWQLPSRSRSWIRVFFLVAALYCCFTCGTRKTSMKSCHDAMSMSQFIIHRMVLPFAGSDVASSGQLFHSL